MSSVSVFYLNSKRQTCGIIVAKPDECTIAIPFAIIPIDETIKMLEDSLAMLRAVAAAPKTTEP